MTSPAWVLISSPTITRTGPDQLAAAFIAAASRCDR